MKVNRDKLLSVLWAVKPGLAKKQIVEMATHFVFTKFDLLTYNDQICVAHPFETDFQCSVPSEQFYRIISGITAEEIDLTLDEGKLMIKAGKTKASLVAASGESIIKTVDALDLNSVMDNLRALPEDFIQGVELCLFSAGKDASRPVLTSLLIEDDMIMSSDAIRISQYKMKQAIDCSVLIPASALAEVIKSPIVDYHVTESWAFFATADDVLFCCRILAEKPYNYYPFFEGYEDIAPIEFPSDAADVIRTSSTITEGTVDRDKFVEIEISKNKLKVKGESSAGWIESEAEINFKSAEPVKFFVNPEFILKILEHSTKMFYKENRALFVAGEFKHLMALKV